MLLCEGPRETFEARSSVEPAQKLPERPNAARVIAGRQQHRLRQPANTVLDRDRSRRLGGLLRICDVGWDAHRVAPLRIPSAAFGNRPVATAPDPDCLPPADA